MNKKLLLSVIFPLILAACSLNEPESPFQPLAKVTISFEKQSEFNVAAADHKEKQRITQTADAIALTQSAVPEEIPFEAKQADLATPEYRVEDAPFTVEVVQPEPTATLESFFSTNEIAGDSGYSAYQDPNMIPTDANPFSGNYNEAPSQPYFEPTAIVENDPFGAAQEAYTAPEMVQPAQPTGPIIINPFSTDSRGYTIYTLQEGESLTCLARRFNFNLSEFMAANGLSSATDAGAGDSIILPPNINTWSVYDGSRIAMRHPVVYTVEAGDNFFSIACKFGDVFPDDIANANGMGNGDLLIAGKQITIP